jgi:hypothetical protein
MPAVKLDLSGTVLQSIFEEIFGEEAIKQLLSNFKPFGAGKNEICNPFKKC